MNQNEETGALAPEQPNIIQGESRYASSASDGIARNAKGLFRFFMIRCGNDHDMAEDLMQELCLQISKSVAPATDDDSRIDAWLFGVGRNVLRRHWRTIIRRRRNIPTVDNELAGNLAQAIDTKPLPHETLHRREVQQQVMLAITSLGQVDQDVLLKYYFDGKSQNQIAEEMRMSSRAVEGRLYRARQAMKEKLSGLE